MNKLKCGTEILNKFLAHQNLSKIIRNYHFNQKIDQILAKRNPVKHCQIKHSTWNNPKTPELIYVPHFARWIKTKLKFKYLQKMWDPDFTEGAFIYGSTQAVCRITEIISENKLKELNQLVTEDVRLKLKENVSRLSSFQRQLLKIKREDIKILVPLQVNLIKNGEDKTCNVTLRILALKWFEMTGNLKLVLIALQSEFTRDYSKDAAPEWTVSSFEILECSLLGRPSNKP